jgi:NTE family protein
MRSTDPKVRDTIERYFHQTLNDEDLASFEMRSLRGGEWLFRQGDMGDSLYFLVRGRLQVWVEADHEGNDEQAVLMGEVAPGDTVGEVGLLSDEPRSAGILAIRDSLLIEIDRPSFVRLAERYPSMVMNLAANVATLLQRRTSHKKSAARKWKTICLLPITGGEAIEEFCTALTDTLKAGRKTLALTPELLVEMQAPQAQASIENSQSETRLPQELRHWLGDQEDDYDFIIYRCASSGGAWSRFAVRQSDIVLEIGEASRQPFAEHKAARSDTARAPAGPRALILLHEQRSAIRDTALWLEDREFDFHLHAEIGSRADVQRTARVLSGTAVGLVLGGGAARGLAALGVYRALCEAGVPIDWVGGTSIGSILSAQIALGWDPELAIANSRAAFKDGKPFSDFTIPVISLLRGRRMRRLLARYLDYQIEDACLPYYCVSTNLGRGTKNIHTRGSLVDAICASAALPGVIPPAIVDSELTVDGALLDNLPVDIMQRKPVGRIIAVDVSSRVHKTVPFNEMPSPWAILRGRWLPFARKYSVPSLTTLMLKATEIGTLELARRHGEMADLLIDPPVRQFGMMDTRSFDRIVQAGYDRAKELLDSWEWNEPVT